VRYRPERRYARRHDSVARESGADAGEGRRGADPVKDRRRHAEQQRSEDFGDTAAGRVPANGRARCQEVRPPSAPRKKVVFTALPGTGPHKKDSSGSAPLPSTETTNSPAPPPDLSPPATDPPIRKAPSLLQ